MVDLIVTGHGEFATGIKSSLELIAGRQKNVHCVNFLQGDSVEDLEINLENVMRELDENIIVLADLMGGSPFKTSVLLSNKLNDKNIRVVSGTNLGMLLEIALGAEFYSLDDAVDVALNAGKIAVTTFEVNKDEYIEDLEFEDGI